MALNKARFSAMVGFVAFGLVPLLGGCGNSLGPGDYRVYKVALQAGALSTNCFAPQTEADPNTKNDTDSTLTSATWLMTADANDGYFLDRVANTLAGKETDTGYTFSGQKVDVQVQPGGDVTGAQRTTTVDHLVEMTVDGKLITGTDVTTTTRVCAGTMCQDTDAHLCTLTSKFDGTQIDDVDIGTN